MIKWNDLAVSVPEADREFVAKNDSKIISENSSAKKCRVMKFGHLFKSEKIAETLLNDGFTVWAYTD